MCSLEMKSFIVLDVHILAKDNFKHWLCPLLSTSNKLILLGEYPIFTVVNNLLLMTKHIFM